jgi:hypothetical protein
MIRLRNVLPACRQPNRPIAERLIEAPINYADKVPTVSLNGGIVDFTLAATLTEVLEDGTRRQRVIVVADIEMPRATATSLRDLLDRLSWRRNRRSVALIKFGSLREFRQRLPRWRCRARKPQHHRIVDRPLADIPKQRAGGHSRRRQFPAGPVAIFPACGPETCPSVRA